MPAGDAANDLLSRVRVALARVRDSEGPMNPFCLIHGRGPRA
jgi:hypothetical protein